MRLLRNICFTAALLLAPIAQATVVYVPAEAISLGIGGLETHNAGTKNAYDTINMTSGDVADGSSFRFVTPFDYVSGNVTVTIQWQAGAINAGEKACFNLGFFLMDEGADSDDMTDTVTCSIQQTIGVLEGLNELVHYTPATICSFSTLSAAANEEVKVTISPEVCAPAITGELKIRWVQLDF